MLNFKGAKSQRKHKGDRAICFQNKPHWLQVPHNASIKPHWLQVPLYKEINQTTG